jgi:hypothetical protein
MVYAPVSDTNLILKWYSGYNATEANDVVYFGTSSNPTTQIGSPVPATRGQHSSTVDVNISPNQTYYFKVVTGGTVSSDIWSFKTVKWQCQMPNDTGQLGWPDWDAPSHNCVIDFEDLAYFAEHWNDASFGIMYLIDMPELVRFSEEWLQCRGRTNSGCDLPW